MNLEESWRESDPSDDDLSSLIKPGLSRITSKDPLNRLKRNLLTSVLMGVVLALCYIYVMFEFAVWQVFTCIGIVFLFTVWATVRSLQLYITINRIIPGNTLLQEMEGYYVNIKKWLSIQQQVALFIYPISAAGGFMIGGSLGAGKSISEVMQKPAMIIALLIVTAVLVPICFYFAKWMSKKAFGNYVDQLKENIDILKSGI